MILSVFGVIFDVSGLDSDHQIALLKEYAPSSSDETTNPIFSFSLTDSLVNDDAILVKRPVGIDQEGIFLHDDKGHIIRIDWSSVGLEMTCIQVHPKFNLHFLLIIIEYLAYLVLLSKGKALVHASSLIIDDKLVIMPSTRNIGKTNTLLGILLAKPDCSYVSDEWILLSKHQNVTGVSKPISLMSYNVEKILQTNVSMPSYTRDILGFIQNALQGVYELDDLTVEEIRSGFRFKLPPSQVFKNVATSALDEIPFFVYLFKDYSHTNNSSLESLSVPDLVRLMMLDLKIEHEPFRLAYEVWLSRGSK